MAKKLKSLNPIIGTGYKTLSMIKDGEDGNIENFPDTLPEIPRLSYKRLGVAGLEIGWEFEDKIYYTYELYGSTTKGFEASEENLMFQGLASSYFYEAKPGEKWYFKARAKNTHGRYTEFSSELVAYTIKLDNLGEYVEGGSINGALIENATINNAHIKDLHADKITAGVLDADRIGANSITANKIEANAITSEKIQANAITTGKIQANAITTDKLAANIIASNHIQAGAITSGHIQSGTIESGHIKAGTIVSDHIQANTIQSEHIQTGAITAGSGIIADGAIGSAQISSLDAAKIEAGTIDTSKVTIQGADGHLRLKGNRLQVFQGTGNQAKERVSVGDVNGDGTKFGLRVRGADGQTILLDENGVTSEGITDGSITNDKISDDANIDGAKLNINSVVSKINEDGTETIQGTKIEVDGTTLNTKLSTITNKQTEDSERITQAQSQITANTNAIKLKVDEQTYTTDKKDMTSKLEKNTSEISTMKGQIALKVEQTDITNAISNINIGARNIFQGYGDEEIALPAYQNTGSFKQFNNCLTINPAEYVGEQFTISFYAKSPNGTTQLQVYNSNGNPRYFYFQATLDTALGDTWKYYTYTFTNIDRSQFTAIYNRIEIYAPNQMGVLVKKIKIEKGNKATDWTPAPEDVSQDATNKSNQALTDANKYTASEISKTNSQVASITADLGGIKSKVETVESESYKIKNFGDELVSQKFKTGDFSYFSPQDGLKYEPYWADNSLIIYGKQFVRGEFIPVDFRNQLYCMIKFNNWGGGQFYFGIEQYNKDKVELGVNALTKYVVSGNKIPDNKWQTQESFITLDKDCSYIRVRILTNWDNGINTSTNPYNQIAINELSVKQLGSEISSHLSTRMRVAEQKITDSSITSVVQSSQFIKDMNGKITTNTSNISKVEQTANSINSTVKDLSGKYTEIKQTVDSINLTGKVSFSDLSTSGKTTINGSNITSGTLDASKVNVTNLNASNIKSGTISADRLDANTIVSKVNGGTTEINGNRIQTGTLSASKITTGELNASKVSVTNLNAGNITSGTISADRIASNSITSSKIASGAITANMITSGTMSANRITGGALRSSNGDMYFDMDNGYMVLYNSGTRVGQTLKNNISGKDIYGLTNGCEYTSYACLGAKTSSSTSNYTMMVSVAGKDLTDSIRKGVNIGAATYSNGHNFNLHNSYLCFGLGASSYSAVGQIRWYSSTSSSSDYGWIGNVNTSNMGIYGRTGAYVGYRDSSGNNGIFSVTATADSYNAKAHIWSNLNMHNYKIRYCQGVAAASVELSEPIPFAYSKTRDGEYEQIENTYNVVKTKQNIVESIGSVTITEDMVDTEIYIKLDGYVAYKNYIVILSPIGEDRKVCILRKEDDGFYIKGNQGEVDYTVKFECIDVAKYRSATGENVPQFPDEEKEEPKEVVLEM